MSKIIVKEYPFKANSWDSFPNIEIIRLPHGAEIVDFRCTGCDVTLFVQHDEYAELEDREVRLYRLRASFIPPHPSEFMRLGIVGEACNKSVAYLALNPPKDEPNEKKNEY